MDIKELTIDRIGLSGRSRNALRRANVHTVGELLPYTEASLRELRNVGDTTVQEILAVIEKCKALEEPAISSDQGETCEEMSGSPQPEDYDEWIATVNGREFICTWMEGKDEGIEVLETLPARAYNLLRLNGYRKLHQIIFMGKADLLRLPHMSVRSADDIEKA